jgi:hypothetical protein
MPRAVRRAAHPVRILRHAATLGTVKQSRHALHPLDNAIYQADRSLTRSHRLWPIRSLAVGGRLSDEHARVPADAVTAANA